ncbi:MAG TPA: hypothetical protein GX743_08145 [Actinomycetales bacterium]|nr:hypothetical protein [Actinomycetales bacterium]
MHTGAYTVTFESGEVRELRHASGSGHANTSAEELLQRVYPTVRDADWATHTPRVESASTTRDPESGALTHEAHLTYQVGDTELEARITATVQDPELAHGVPLGTPAPLLDYLATFTFHGPLDYNRIGIAAHHPLTIAGSRVTWDGASGPLAPEDADGSGTLPELIAKVEERDGHDVPLIGPFRRLTIAGPARTLTLDLTGDDFELEDQRTYSDPSFKTYCTPQSPQAPHHAPAGTVLEQRLTLTLTPASEGSAAPGDASAPSGESPGHYSTETSADNPVDGVGYVPSTDVTPAVGEVVPVLAVLADAEDAPESAQLELARRLGFTAVAVSSDHESDWVEAAHEAGLMVVDRPEDSPGLKELQHEDLAGRDLVWFSINPFVHANDEWSLSRAPESLPVMVATVREIAGEAEVWLGPLHWDEDSATAKFPPAPGQEERPRPSEQARVWWLVRMLAQARVLNLDGVAPVWLAELEKIAVHPELEAVLCGWDGS